MDCSLLINTAYVTAEYHQNQKHITLEAKSNDCIVKVCTKKSPCKPCVPCVPCRPCNPCIPRPCVPCNPCTPCDSYRSHHLCAPFEKTAQEIIDNLEFEMYYEPSGEVEIVSSDSLNQSRAILLEESYSIVTLPSFKQLGAIYPRECKLNWYTLQGKRCLEIECHYTILYYDKLGQRKSCTICVKHNDRYIERQRICCYRLKISQYSWKVIERNKLEINIKGVLEIN